MQPTKLRELIESTAVRQGEGPKPELIEFPASTFREFPRDPVLSPQTDELLDLPPPRPERGVRLGL